MSWLYTSRRCQKYRDVDGWLTEVRRWPSPLVELQRSFLIESRRGVLSKKPLA